MDEKIIKPVPDAAAAVAPLRKLVKGQMFAAGVEAKDIVEDAQEKAASILSAAEAQAVALRETARQEGYAAGLAQWNEAVFSAQQVADAYFQKAEPDVVRLAVAIARKIIGEELRLAPDAIVGIVKQAMENVRGGRQFTLQVNPANVDDVRRRVGELQSTVGATSDLRVVGSATVAPGGCVVESEFGVVDARLDTQLEALERALLKGAKR